jgi:modulator of FtsH protease HflC
MRGIFVTVIIAFLLILGITQAAYVIQEWQLGLVLQFGKPIRTVMEPGLKFKYPFVQDVTIFDKRILAADAPPQTYITLDKKRLIVDTVSRWRISDPLVFFTTVRDYKRAVARLNDVISARLRQEIANEFFQNFIREKREDIMEEVSKGTAQSAAPFGIDVIDVRIKRVDLPEEVQASVFARMKAERERIAKRYRAEGNEQAREIRANADKEREILLAEAYRKAQASRGEGDAEAAAIYAKAYGENLEFYSFSKHLEVYEKVFRSDTTILLRPDSQLLRFLDTPGGDFPSGGEADK